MNYDKNYTKKASDSQVHEAQKKPQLGDRELVLPPEPADEECDAIATLKLAGSRLQEMSDL